MPNPKKFVDYEQLFGSQFPDHFSTVVKKDIDTGPFLGVTCAWAGVSKRLLFMAHS